jgi:hypothetical protein
MSAPKKRSSFIFSKKKKQSEDKDNDGSVISPREEQKEGIIQ